MAEIQTLSQIRAALRDGDKRLELLERFRMDTAVAAGEANTASNRGAGVGVYDSKLGVDLRFRSLVSPLGSVTIALDAINHEIDLEVAAAGVTHNLLGGLQGGAVGEFYHLPQSEHDDLVDVNAQLGALHTDGSPTFAGLTMTGDIAMGGNNITGVGTVDGVTVSAHAARHEDLGADEIDVGGLSGLLADAQTPTAHAIGSAGGFHTGAGLTIGHVLRASGAAAFVFAELQHGDLGGVGTDDHHAQIHAGSHENAGGDEISVLGLSGLLADDQNPVAHAGDHENAGADEISVLGLSGELADAQPVAISKNSGAIVGTRSELNFIEGANITLTIADDVGNNEVDITIASAGGVAAHDILSLTHTDTLAAAVSQGSLVYGNGTPKWAELVIGGAGTLLRSDGADVAWASLATAGIQPLDATLTSLALLGTAADKMAYTTGVDVWAETAITAFGRSILDDANQAAVQATLALTPGTNVQAYDATLLSIAALGTGANKLAYTTGVDTWAETALTAFGRSILDDADAATVLATIGAAAAGAAPTAHTHDGDTLEHDGVNSNGGAFPFTTTGIVTFNQNVVTTGNFKVADGGTIGTATTADAITISAAGVPTIKDTLISPAVQITGIAVSRMMGISAAGFATSENLDDWIAGTADQITVTDDADGSVTLSLEQDIDTAATPTFAHLYLTATGTVASTVDNSYTALLGGTTLMAGAYVAVFGEGGSGAANIIHDADGSAGIFKVAHTVAAATTTEFTISEAGLARFYFGVTMDSTLHVVGNITTDGTVDGVDVAGLAADVNGFPDELKNLVTAEIQQLENIGATTISAAQWGYLGALDQSLTSTSVVTHDEVLVAVGGIGDPGYAFTGKATTGWYSVSNHFAYTYGGTQVGTWGDDYFAVTAGGGGFRTPDGGFFGSASDPDAIAIAAGGDVTFSQQVGIGTAPSYPLQFGEIDNVARLIDLTDQGVSCTGNRQAIVVDQRVTAGTKGGDEDLDGLNVTMALNQSAATIDWLRGAYIRGFLDDGTCDDLYGAYITARQDGGTADAAVGLYSLVDLNAGAVSGSVYGSIMQVDQEAANTISGDVFGFDVRLYGDGTVTGEKITARFYSHGDTIVRIRGYEGKDAALQLHADQGDDNFDKWQIKAQATGNPFHISQWVGASYNVYLQIASGGAVTIPSLAGVGSRAVVADANGKLSAP